MIGTLNKINHSLLHLRWVKKTLSLRKGWLVEWGFSLFVWLVLFFKEEGLVSFLHEKTNLKYSKDTKGFRYLIISQDLSARLF